MGAGHDHGHGGHSHGHGHSHAAATAAPDQRRRIGFAFAITASIFVAQLVGALLTGSLALLTDTAHMLTDVLGLAVAYVASHLMLRPASSRRTWGFRRIEVLAAQAQAGILLAVGLFAAVEGIRRLSHPPEVPSTELLVFGAIGLVGNLIAVAVLASDRSSTFNLRAAFLEAASDALGSVGVIVAALVIGATGWQQADAVAGLVIVALILPRAVVLLKDTAAVLMEFTPPGLDLDEVRAHLLEVPHVQAVHELHASMVASGLPVLSAHVVLSDECFNTGHAVEILHDIKECIAEHFAISHSTIELEPPGFVEVDPAHHD